MRELAQQSVAVLHQEVGSERQSGFLTESLAHESCVRISLRFVRVVAAPLAVEIHPPVAIAARRIVVVKVLLAEALERCPRFDEGTVDGEMLIAHEVSDLRLGYDCGQELTSDVVLHQTRPILRKGTVVEAVLIHVHV